GVEVVVQALMALDGECLIFKGRLAASQDAGRLFFVPFDQIDYVGFTRTVAEEEFRAWFGEAPPAAAATDAPADQQAQANGAARKAGTPSRAALLERVRARTSSPGLGVSGISLPSPPPTST